MLLDIENLPIFPFSRERKGKTGESERRGAFIAQCLLLFFGPSIASCEPHEARTNRIIWEAFPESALFSLPNFPASFSFTARLWCW